MEAFAGIGLYLVFGAVVLAALPASPFTAFMNMLGNSQILEFLAWAVPVTQMIAILQAWLVAISVFYVIMMLARWVKVID